MLFWSGTTLPLTTVAQCQIIIHSVCKILVISNTANHHLEQYDGMNTSNLLPWECYLLLPSVPHEGNMASAFSQPTLTCTEQKFCFTSELPFAEGKCVDQMYLQSLIRWALTPARIQVWDEEQGIATIDPKLPLILYLFQIEDSLNQPSEHKIADWLSSLKVRKKDRRGNPACTIGTDKETKYAYPFRRNR